MSPLATTGSDGGGAAAVGGVTDATVGEPTCDGVPAFVDGGVDATGSNGAGLETVAAGGDAGGLGGEVACATGGFAAARADESLSSRPG